MYIQFWKGHIPTRVSAPQMDPKSVLLDPIGAIVGSIALLVTLVIITGTGFAGIISVKEVNQRCVGMDDFFAKCSDKGHLRHGLGCGQSR